MSTVEEVIARESFKDELWQEVKDFECRRAFKALGKDQRFKISPYDHLRAKMMFNAPDLLSEYAKIQGKKSKLSSSERSFVVFMVKSTAIKIIRHECDIARAKACKSVPVDKVIVGKER